MIEQDVVINTKYGASPATPRARASPARIRRSSSTWTRRAFATSSRSRRGASRATATSAWYPTSTTGSGTLRFDIPRRNEQMSAVIRAAMQSLTNTGVPEDTAGMIAFLDGPGQGEGRPARLRRPLHERARSR
jgi:carboxymethylenebutenolidase